MGFFKNMARNGLAKRLIAYTGVHPFVALEVAAANYPKPPDEEPLLPPIIPTGQVQRATAMFLEQGWHPRRPLPGDLGQVRRGVLLCSPA